MKIGILTFHCAVNYGAVLQTYCLQEVLKSMGHEVYVIDYRPMYLIKSYKTFSYNPNNFGSYLYKCQGLLRACLVAPIRWKRNRAFSQFIHHRLNLYQLDLNNESNDFDAFVLGSDQIWNSDITCGTDNVFIGDFPAVKDKQLISYAASMGGRVFNLNNNDIKSLEYIVKHFSSISVREQSLHDLFKVYFKKEVPTVLDPVLLVQNKALEHIVNDGNKFDKKYLLLFQPEGDKALSLYARKIADKMGLELIEIVSGIESIINIKWKQALSPEEFLCYISNAFYIITSSFHGTALSILFRKNFLTVSRCLETDCRMLSMLKLLGLEDRMCTINSEFVFPEIDYLLVDKKLNHLRMNSMTYLKNALNK